MENRERTTKSFEVVANGDPKFPFKANMGGYIFRTEAAALEFCTKCNEFIATMNTIRDVPSELSRQAYKDVCQGLGIAPLSDEECDSYGVRFGDFQPPLYTGDYARKMALAYKRLMGMDEEAAATPQPMERPVEMFRCDCGHSVPRAQAMSASRGSSCPDCYDRMSD